MNGLFLSSGGTMKQCHRWAGFKAGVTPPVEKFYEFALPYKKGLSWIDYVWSNQNECFTTSDLRLSDFSIFVNNYTYTGKYYTSTKDIVYTLDKSFNVDPKTVNIMDWTCINGQPKRLDRGQGLICCQVTVCGIFSQNNNYLDGITDIDRHQFQSAVESVFYHLAQQDGSYGIYDFGNGNEDVLDKLFIPAPLTSHSKQTFYDPKHPAYKVGDSTAFSPRPVFNSLGELSGTFYVPHTSDREYGLVPDLTLPKYTYNATSDGVVLTRCKFGGILR